MNLKSFTGKQQERDAEKYAKEVNDKLCTLFVYINDRCEELDLEFICEYYDTIPTYSFIDFKMPYVSTNWKLKGSHPLLMFVAIFMPPYKLITHYVELFSEAAYHFKFLNKKTKVMYSWTVSDLALVTTNNLLLCEDFERSISKTKKRK